MIRPGFATLTAYCDANGLALTRSESISLGGRLRRYCDNFGVPYGEKETEEDGHKVRSWPVAILDAWRNGEVNLSADPAWKPKPSPFRHWREVLAELERQKTEPIPEGVPKPPWID